MFISLYDLFSLITVDVKHNELSFQLMVDASPIALILVNSFGKITFLNSYAGKLFLYSKNELIGQDLGILLPEKYRLVHPELLKEYFVHPVTRQMGKNREFYAVKKNEIEFPVEIGLNPMVTAEGTLVLAVIIDITERKKNEEAIRLYTKQIEDKNKELEQFTFIASHDLREPLNSISSLIDFLVEHESHKLDKETLKKLNYISGSAARMTNLVKGLLDYARLGKNEEFERIDFNEIVEEVVNDLEISIQSSKAKIRVNKLPVLNGLKMEIRLLFQNLISNAIKYRKPDCNPEIDISAKKVKAGWEIAVADNGIGIPSDQKEKIFVIFQRLHGRDEYDGIGIGLAHCRKIMELHDGRIWVESELNIGSTFYFLIPSK